MAKSTPSPVLTPVGPDHRHVAEVDDPLDALRPDVGKHGLQRQIISVHVGNRGKTHPKFQSLSRHANHYAGGVPFQAGGVPYQAGGVPLTARTWPAR
jgi:hypothetical protein